MCMQMNLSQGWSFTDYVHTDSVVHWLLRFVLDRNGEPAPSSTLLLLQAHLSAKETKVQALQKEMHTQASELAELRAHQESFKESERLLQRTHDDMVC